MMKYFNRKAIVSLLVTGTIAVSMSSCGAKIVSMPAFLETSTTLEQEIKDYKDIEILIEQTINNQTASEGSNYYSAVRVIGSHQAEGKPNQYDAIVAQGIFHSEIYDGKVFSIENDGTNSVNLETVEVENNQIINTTVCIEGLENYNSQDPIMNTLNEQFSEESIRYLKNNSSLKDTMIKEKYMNAIGNASYVTTAPNFEELITHGHAICIDEEGHTVKVEPEQKAMQK